MRKNTAGQKIAAQMITAATGAAFTGSVDVYLVGDNGAQALAGSATHKGNGCYIYLPTQAQTNFDHVAFTFVGTGAINATVQVFTWVDQDLTKVRAATYDSAAVVDGDITLSNGAVQRISGAGRVTT